jgi:asparagine synthase (glutamine-hydrolysing)
MCGIVGGFGTQINHSWVTSQTSRLAYRGPDFQADISFSEELHFGSARLAMTDPLPRSNQPFKTKKSALIFNGEIYNYKEIRAELKLLNQTFETDSDTEVLIKSLEQWGSEAYGKFQGMFAFAYYNFEDESLILARDPLGKKPLYYSISKDTVHWSSSVKSLNDLIDNYEINTSSLFDYLALGYTIDPNNLYGKFLSVIPGHFIKFKLDNGILIELEGHKRNVQTRVCSKKDNLRQNIIEAVESRIEGHEAVAVSLSGGLDSAIVALVASQTDKKVTAYSASWPDSDKARYNLDSQSASEISKNLGIEYCEVEIFHAENLDQNLREFVHAMEEPNSNPSGLSMLNLYRRIAEDSHRLVLTGDGADEILGGYPRYKALTKLPNILHLNSQLVSKILDRERSKLSSRLLQFLVSQSSNKNYDNWLHWHWNFTPKELQRLAPGIFHSTESRELRERFSFVQPKIDLNSVSFNMQMDREVWLSMESNRKLDRISMHYSIEARSPFQDERVIESGLKYMESNNYRKLGKSILKDAFPELESIGVREDKSGFISPVGHWLRKNPGIVTKSLKELSELFPLDQNVLKDLAAAPSRGDFRKIMQLWSLVVLSYWVRENNEK